MRARAGKKRNGKGGRGSRVCISAEIRSVELQGRLSVSVWKSSFSDAFVCLSSARNLKFEFESSVLL